jgi:hypothetical protein
VRAVCGRAGEKQRPGGGSVWVDDFEGHWPNVEDVDDDRLVEIRKKTVEAIDDPILLSQQPFAWYWEDQLQRISGEMRRRGLDL